MDAEFIADEALVFELLESRTREVINRTEDFGEMLTFSDAEAAPLVADSVRSQLRVLRREQYLDFEDGHYSARLALRDGRFSINDKPLTLQSFMP